LPWDECERCGNWLKECYYYYNYSSEDSHLVHTYCGCSNGKNIVRDRREDSETIKEEKESEEIQEITTTTTTTLDSFLIRK
jgi:hypothetical protein